LYSKDGKFFAQVQADSSLSLNGSVGSIHKISAMILKKENNNGWSYWYIKREQGMISIDQLRHDYEKKFMQTESKNYNTELQFEKNIINEPEESFLNYGNNGI
jgi:hypothetical protein